MNNLDCNASNHSPVWGVTEFVFLEISAKKMGRWCTVWALFQR